MKHFFERMSCCIYCGWLCESCNQCRCETNMKFTCPGFDTKRHKARFETWKKDRAAAREASDRDFRYRHHHSFDLPFVWVDDIPVPVQVLVDAARSAR